MGGAEAACILTAVRDLVGYGRHRPQGTWPGGARLAVSVVVNLEEGAERNFPDDGIQEPMIGEGLVASEGARNMYGESAYEYGSRVGVWRVLDILAKHQVPATFFASARALEKNPEAARAIVDGGHEICGHGYRWLEAHYMSLDEEREDMRRAVETVTRLTGARPLGWASRGAGPHTRRLIAEEGGFLYDSGAFNDDLPYVVEVGGKRLVVVPYSRDVNDIRFWRGSFMVARHFQEYADTALDRLREESAESLRMLSVGVHCRIIGVPGRAPALDGFLTRARSFRDLWFATRIQIARAWLERPDVERAQ